MTSRGGFDVNHQQAAIVDHVLTQKATIASAGAGSGKTYTMVASVMELIEHGRDDKRPLTIDDFAIVTFTTEAAAQLRSSIETALAQRVETTHDPFWSEQQERLTSAFVGTIHGFCHRLLRRYGYPSHVPRSSAITGSRTLFREALRDEYESVFRRSSDLGALQDVTLAEYDLIALLEAIHEHILTVGIAPDDMAVSTESLVGGRGDVRMAVALLLARADSQYQRVKLERGLLDVHDLLLRLDEVLRQGNGSELARRIAADFRIVFIDEFQDTDRVQVSVLEQLLPHLSRLLVVGDVKQSIYGFRAADSRLLNELATRISTEIQSLNISRRPTQELLRAQNALFAHLAGRYPELADPLEPYEESPAAPTDRSPVIHDPSPTQAIPWAIAWWVRTLLGTNVLVEGKVQAATAGDIVLLCRTNRQVDEYSREVSKKLDGVPEVRPARGSTFFNQPEVVATYRLLQLMLHPREDAILAAALETMFFESVDPSERIHELVQYGHLHGAPITDWFRNHHPNEARWVEDARTRLRSDTAPQLLARLYESSGVIERLREQSRHESIVVLEALREESRSLFRNEQALTVAAFADWLRVAIQQGFPTARDRTHESRPDHVRAMTIHQAKGLEFPIVIIPDMQRAIASDFNAPQYILHDHDALDLRVTLNNGSSKSDSWGGVLASHRTAQIKEEFRLLYVAVTRAEQQVVLVGDRPNAGNVLNPRLSAYAWVDELNAISADILPRQRFDA